MLLALRGLHYAHTKGIVHCDFKPNNILVSRSGRVLVTDFGMAYPDPKSVRLTAKGKIFLTPAFMPPEVAVEIESQGPVKELFSETSPVSAGADAAERLKKPDIRRDIWSAGVIFCRILSGRFPFTGENIPQLIGSILLTDVPSIETIAPSLPSSLTATIGTCLERNPEKRLATLEPLIEPLEKFFIDLNISDCEKEVSSFFADAGAVVRRIEQKLLIYHNREWRACKRAGNASRATVHFKEAERLASLVLTSAGVAPSPIKLEPRPWQRKKYRKNFVVAAAAAAAAVAGAVGIAMFLAAGGLNKKNPQPALPAIAAAAAPQQRPSKQPDVSEPLAAVSVDAMADVVDSVKTQLTNSQSMLADTSVTTAAPTTDSAGAGAAVRPSAAAIAPQKFGILKISITPVDAKVFADEKPFSEQETAAGRRMKTGPHFVVATADGYEPYWGSLDIAANLTSTLSIRLSPVPENHGTLLLTASPTSSVYVDGVFRGSSQKLQAVPLKTGEHFVALRCRGYRAYEKSVVIDSGGVTAIEAVLVPSGN
jgi:hypothetical protein